MRKRRATLGRKVYQVLLANVQGDAIVEVVAHNADMAKRVAAGRYARDGWTVMSARAAKISPQDSKII